jgi:hypothetical protein
MVEGIGELVKFAETLILGHLQDCLLSQGIDEVAFRQSLEQLVPEGYVDEVVRKLHRFHLEIRVVILLAVLLVELDVLEVEELPLGEDVLLEPFVLVVVYLYRNSFPAIIRGAP